MMWVRQEEHVRGFSLSSVIHSGSREPSPGVRESYVSLARVQDADFRSIFLYIILKHGSDWDDREDQTRRQNLSAITVPEKARSAFLRDHQCWVPVFRQRSRIFPVSERDNAYWDTGARLYQSLFGVASDIWDRASEGKYIALFPYELPVSTLRPPVWPHPHEQCTHCPLPECPFSRVHRNYEVSHDARWLMIQWLVRDSRREWRLPYDRQSVR